MIRHLFCSAFSCSYSSLSSSARPLHLVQNSHFSTFSNYPSPLRRQEYESQNVPVSVWWDFKTCNVPDDVNFYNIAHRIREAVRSKGIKGPLQITAFGDVLQLPRANQEALFSSGMNLAHIPNGGKNRVASCLFVDLMCWVSRNPPPSHLFLIFGDKDFVAILHRLRMRNYNILLASPDTVPNFLCSAASIKWRWSSLLKGEYLTKKHYWLPLEDSFLYGQQSTCSQIEELELSDMKSTVSHSEQLQSSELKQIDSHSKEPKLSKRKQTASHSKELGLSKPRQIVDHSGEAELFSSSSFRSYMESKDKDKQGNENAGSVITDKKECCRKGGNFTRTRTSSSSSSRWSKDEVEALIRLGADFDVEYEGNRPKGPLWEEISCVMEKLGYDRSAKGCKEKWVKEKNKKKSEDSKMRPYFHQFDTLCSSEKPKRMEESVGSSKNQVCPKNKRIK